MGIKMPVVPSRREAASSEPVAHSPRPIEQGSRIDTVSYTHLAVICFDFQNLRRCSQRMDGNYLLHLAAGRNPVCLLYTSYASSAMARTLPRVIRLPWVRQSESLPLSPSAVSYTHLDVYKRQVHQLSRQWHSWAAKCGKDKR